MNALLLRNLGGLRRSSSLQSFAEYRQAEAQNPQMSSVTSEGALLEYETLELRIHPPNVVIDNDTYDDMTVITIDSANRPGTLIEVVQCLTELGLSIRCARISSDGGWFVDEFFVTETPKGKLLDPRKINIIRKVLSVESDSSASYKDKDICTVFELAGRDRHGLLAAVLQLLVVNGCEVLSAAVWTFHDRVALVISATERGAPVVDPVKLDRLEQILYDMLGSGDAVVNSELVRGQVHHERRLHHLLLLEELKAWEQQYVATSTTPTHASSKRSTQNGTLHLSPSPPPPPQAAAAVPDGGGGATAGVMFARASVGLPASTGPSAPTSGLPSRAPSPSPMLYGHHGGGGGAAAGVPGLHAEHSGSVGMPSAVPGYTPAGFPQADEGGAACPQAAALGAAAAAGDHLADGAGGGGPFSAAAPAGPFDLPPGAMARCASTDGPLPLMVSEPMIDVGLDLPAAVQLKDQVSAQLLDRRRSTTGPPADVLGAAAAMAAAVPSSPALYASTNGSTTTTAAPPPPLPSGRSMERSVSSNALQGSTATSGGGAPPAAAATAAAPPHRTISGKTMTVTGDEVVTGQPALAPAPTATVATVGGTDGAAHDQLAQLRRSEVRIQHSALLNYWLVTIQCRDRNKLFFDTVCTLADMNYDIYHATIDSEGDAASQLFYVRPRYGECIWDERRAAKLRYMLESAVQRRFPRGTKVCVQSSDRSALVNLFSALSSAGFWITRLVGRVNVSAGGALPLASAPSSTVSPPPPPPVSTALQ
ncbi:hypothetical protein VOLCADRAFT_97579 [Volvox carteri f. nagariensis]|uniref:ACT domain-containing protein n=1 Tax=Volvox carteri f. nagariensis TaxID=3068 RepID=D8UD35_VOLCA|nr:uncharacterized protein VOLCADRAFT_97579 [Volvox carteri f. nagariensis]EFJ42325.1 hypothetical protein VOLCADRAFT_97579 [Volvox carteri f. nagariensis]|eukprot:XP_002956558.1 hypothetical protein VOLCADRAFT_97579 [Volvox carteri f. nagariensis]